MRLTMVGTGYVGLVTGTCLANKGNDVTCLDIDAGKIAQLQAGRVPIYEPGLEEMIEHNVRAGRLHFTTDKDAAYRPAEAVFICVGTPSDDRGRADLTAVIAVARDIAAAMQAAPGATGGDADNDPEKIVIVKSTVPVGTNARVKAELAAHTSKPFHMASNPEFLKEGAAINDFNKPDRVVIGVETDHAADRLRDLYTPFVRQGNPIYTMDIPSAEMVKYASNCMLATKISFINEIASLCESFGADIDQVRLGMCADARIGNKFLYPGLGYGGSCFPKDVLACISMGQESDTPARVLEAVDEVNNAQRQRFIAKIDKHFGGALAGKRVAVWGLAFKPGTDDMRQAPSVTIIRHLLDAGATVAAYDPVAEHTTREVFGDAIAYVDDPIEATDAADALVICTDWDEFKNPDFRAVKKGMKSPVIFDGRNLHRLDAMRRAGFTYYSVGRAVVTP
ncbi:MAG: nucleotide sugar dehydrogenase [Phycisphaera sp.]|nr:nucleotide sugar dehydrogenase [Phycisphaera sp.]